MLPHRDLSLEGERGGVEQEHFGAPPEGDEQGLAVRRQKGRIPLGGELDLLDHLPRPEVHLREELPQGVHGEEAGAVRRDREPAHEAGLGRLVQLDRPHGLEPLVRELEFLDRIGAAAGDVEPLAVRVPGDP